MLCEKSYCVKLRSTFAPIKTVLAVFKSNDLTEQFPQVEEITQVKLFCKSGTKVVSTYEKRQKSKQLTASTNKNCSKPFHGESTKHVLVQ